MQGRVHRAWLGVLIPIGWVWTSDHHSYTPLTLEAAWLNNCVGHYNHRYFFSFCLFMTMGCIYCSISGWDMFRDAYAAIEVSLSEMAPHLLQERKCWHTQRLPSLPRLSLQNKAEPALALY